MERQEESLFGITMFTWEEWDKYFTVLQHRI